jgi:hypothetical protein
LDEPGQVAARLSSARACAGAKMRTAENRRPSVVVGAAPCFRGDPVHTCQRHTWPVTLAREFARRCTSFRSAWDLRPR